MASKPSPSFRGYVRTQTDAILLFELGIRACGLVDPVNFCPLPSLIESGDVFIYDKRQIKNWRHGDNWSRRETKGIFTINRELKQRPQKGAKYVYKDGGLVRKTARVKVGNHWYGLTSYYTEADVKSLKTPLKVFSDIEIRPELRGLLLSYENILYAGVGGNHGGVGGSHGVVQSPRTHPSQLPSIAHYLLQIIHNMDVPDDVKQEKLEKLKNSQERI